MARALPSSSKEDVMLKRLSSSKVFWTSLTAIVVAWGAHLTGEMDLRASIEATFVGVMAIGFRDAMAKGGGTGG